jgi:hypothetical protein
MCSAAAFELAGFGTEGNRDDGVRREAAAKEPGPSYEETRRADLKPHLDSAKSLPPFSQASENNREDEIK